MKGFQLAIGIFLFLGIFENPVDSCSCVFSHIQDQLCGADFVYEFLVKSQETIVNPDGLNEIAYTVAILRRWKTSPKSIEVEKNSTHQPLKLYTNDNSAACGVYLEVHEVYIVAGYIDNDQLRTSLCGLNVRPKDLKSREKEIIYRSMKRCCDCELVVCPEGESCTPTKDQCIFDTYDEDQNNYGICIKDRISRTCKWQISRKPLHIDSSGSSSGSSSLSSNES